MADAKDLHADITKLLLALHEITAKNSEATQEIKVEITGGSF
jgi:hypothetical protein